MHLLGARAERGSTRVALGVTVLEPAAAGTASATAPGKAARPGKGARLRGHTSANHCKQGQESSAYPSKHLLGSTEDPGGSIIQTKQSKLLKERMLSICSMFSWITALSPTSYKDQSFQKQTPNIHHNTLFIKIHPRNTEVKCFYA